ncbi:hypothetical protein NJH49_12300 [Stenotrophomonas maltophilia]|uniref:hypothetical protein n=1 Tax=Stenotrophomonas maltophilia TaxID=40324 RepID=UPI002096AD50|nr:hypothetical protein [Stenotrophomonas maltophilia]MCO7399358.1 hypothetical protein [Stenotrophomonas maltophilia]MCO7412170.1 hypothetical protein [Stenotrophomonas maltophilia]HDS1650839.1 hypothetical protein [Stenotrophomonas maltophilia]
MAKWKASRPEVSPTVPDTEGDLTKSGGNRPIERTLRSWKRGGGEVKVTNGTSTGYEKRQKNPGVSPPDEKPVVHAPAPRIVKPSPRRIPQPGPVLIVKSLRQRLFEASADVHDLRIVAAMSRPRAFAGLAPVVEDKGGRLAILGLDFGTAFTKAVVRWSGHHHAVDWSDAVEGEERNLLASVFSEASDGRCVLGANEASGWSVREGIKLQLLSSEVTSIDGRMSDAVIFIALAFRYVNGWLRRTNRDVDKGLRWRLHVGLPTKSWDSDATAETFKTVAQAARVLACMPGPVTRVAALEALRMTDQVDRPAVDVFPEFACQLYSYLLSPERREDLHALVDIGAGTLDVAYFNVFMKDGEALLPIFASEVDRLGAHYLIAALSGAAGRPVWTDGDSSISDEEAGRRLNCAANDVCGRRSLYLSSVADVFNGATLMAKGTYPTSPAFRRSENVRLFLCGGGSRIPSLKKRFERIAVEAANVMGIKFQVSELVMPHDVVGSFYSGFDRLSVAYGLSQNAANIGRVMRSATLEPISGREVVEEADRDADR